MPWLLSIGTIKLLHLFMVNIPVMRHREAGYFVMVLLVTFSHSACAQYQRQRVLLVIAFA